jgi:hypothetical protein
MKNNYFLALLLMSTLGFAQIQNPEISLTGNPICNLGMCTTYEVNYSPVKATTTYEVNSIPYAPSFPFVGGVQLPLNSDDRWT